MERKSLAIWIKELLLNWGVEDFPNVSSSKLINVRVDSEKNERNRLSKGFIASIILALIAIAIQCLLILMLPELQFRVESYTKLFLDGNNFFYQWDYNWSFNTLTLEYSYYLNSFQASVGFYIFAPIYLVLILLSGTGIFTKNFRETKLLFFVNWGLFLLPIIVYIIAYTRPGLSAMRVIDIMNFLGFCHLYINLLLQISLMIERKTIIEWYKELWSLERFTKKKAIAIWESVYSIIFAIHYLTIWALLLFFTSKYFFNVWLYDIFGIFFGCMLGWVLAFFIVKLILHSLQKTTTEYKSKRAKLKAAGNKKELLVQTVRRLRYAMIILTICFVVMFPIAGLCGYAASCHIVTIGIIFFAGIPITLAITICLIFWILKKKELEEIENPEVIMKEM